MGMLQDVVDGLGLIADGIKDIKEIAEAVRDGRDYVKKKHPEVTVMVRDMLEELRKTTSSIAHTSGVLTNFRFTRLPAGSAASEATRFNEHLIEHNGKAHDLEQQIEAVRGHCSKIRQAAFDIDARAVTNKGIGGLLSLLGLSSAAREQELTKKLDKLAFEEDRTLNAAVRMVTCLNRALRHVQQTLEIDHQPDAKMIPAAAALLAEYSQAFEAIEGPAKAATAEIAAIASSLQ
jgi:hypothetical protein